MAKIDYEYADGGRVEGHYVVILDNGKRRISADTYDEAIEIARQEESEESE